MYEFLYKACLWWVHFLPESVCNFLGYWTGLYFRYAFKDPFFLFSIAISYILIFHSDGLRKRKIQEYAGLTIVAGSIAIGLMVGISKLIQS